MKIVFDTSVILSAFITQGLSSRVLDICIDRHSLYISQFIIDEVSEKLRKKFNADQQQVSKTRSFLLSSFSLIKPAGEKPDVCRDKDDNYILHISDAVNANLIITGDNDLLVLGSHNGAQLITPRTFMEKYHNTH